MKVMHTEYFSLSNISDSVLNVAHTVKSDTRRVWLCESRFWTTYLSKIPRLFYSQRVNWLTVYNSPVLDTRSSQMNPLHIVIRYLFGFLSRVNCEPICRWISQVLSILQNFRRNSFIYFSSVLYVLRDRPMTLSQKLLVVPLKACEYLMNHQV